MPVETLGITFKPNNFFNVNPSMDVPGVKDSNSRLAFSNSAPATDGATGGGGSRSCCVN